VFRTRCLMVVYYYYRRRSCPEVPGSETARHPRCVIGRSCRRAHCTCLLICFIPTSVSRAGCSVVAHKLVQRRKSWGAGPSGGHYVAPVQRISAFTKLTSHPPPFTTHRRSHTTITTITTHHHSPPLITTHHHSPPPTTTTHHHPPPPNTVHHTPPLNRTQTCRATKMVVQRPLVVRWACTFARPWNHVRYSDRARMLVFPL